MQFLRELKEGEFLAGLEEASTTPRVLGLQDMPLGKIRGVFWEIRGDNKGGGLALFQGVCVEFTFFLVEHVDELRLLFWVM